MKWRRTHGTNGARRQALFLMVEVPLWASCLVAPWRTLVADQEPTPTPKPSDPSSRLAMPLDARGLARIRVWALIAALAVLALPAGPAGRYLRLGFSAALLLLLLYLDLVALRRLKKRLVAQHLGDASRAPTARPSLRMAAELPRRVATPAAPPLHVWGEPAASEFRLRGPSYLETGVKMPSGEAMFELVGMDLYACACHDDRLNLSGRRDHWLQQLAAASSRRGVHVARRALAARRHFASSSAAVNAAGVLALALRTCASRSAHATPCSSASAANVAADVPTKPRQRSLSSQ